MTKGGRVVAEASSLPSMHELIEKTNRQMEKLVRSTERLIGAMQQAARISVMQMRTTSVQQRIVVHYQNAVHLTNVIHNNHLRINTTVNRTNVALNQTTLALRQVANAQQQVNQGAQKGKKTSDALLTTLKRTASKWLSVKKMNSLTATSDSYMNSLARIGAINDGTQSNEELQAKILAAANRSRGRYFEMTEYVAKLGLTTPKAFSGNDEMMAFAELSQKAFRLGGAGAAEQQAGMEQLITAMGSGGFKGDDFKTIMKTAPILADAIAKFTGKSTAELIAMSAEGKITADIIKGALFAAADEINGKFEELPKTFGDLKNQLSNQAIAAFGPIFERVNQFLNSSDGQQLIAGISQAIQTAATYVGMLIDGIAMVASFIISNWSIIEPMLWGVVAAVGAWTIAQWLLNFSLSASPIGMIVMAVSVLIGIITALVAWIVNLWRTNDTFAANLYRIWNGILNFFDRIPAYF